MTQTPFPGLTPNLIPNPPGEIPEALGAGDAMAGLSPFKEALDVDAIIKNLVLDRPLKLYIPNREAYPEWEFRIINSVPSEMADATNKGYRQITDPKLVELFVDLVAGTDKTGQAFRPLLYARPKAVGEHIRRQNRRKLQSLYAGMDPKNKDLSGKYTENVDAQAGTKARFEGDGWRIRV
ncbi:MAG: hypothetical protein AAGL98_00045 [Planctomycetota bacterium]